MTIRPYLPSRQFALVFGALVVSGAMVWGASFIGQGKTLRGSFGTLTPGEGASTLGATDSDRDGLLDWEEAARGTDPKLEDTDGDGTRDGDEIKEGRDPAKPGPDDYFSSKEDERFLQELIEQASSTNMTDSISRTLFAEYLSSRKDGSSGDIQTQERLVEEAIAKANAPLRGKTYTEKDLALSTQSAQAIRTFANSAIRVITAYPRASFEATVVVLTGALDEGDPNARQKLLAIGSEYRSMARDLSRIPVPPLFVRSYLGCINALEQAGASFEDLSYITEDPVRAVAGLKNYNAMTVIGAARFAELAGLILNGGILWGDTEPGRRWVEFLPGV